MSQRKKLELQKLDPKTDLALAKAFKPSGGFGEKVYQMKLRDLAQLEKRLGELNQQRAAGEIDDANYQVARDAIERRLKLISSQFETSKDIRQMLYNQYFEQYQSAPDKETLDELVADYKAAMGGNSMGGTPNRVNRMMGSPKTGEMADDPKPLPSDPTEPVNPFKPKPIKPLGDMADKGNDTYAMLRARLPAEIPDDVVSLISYNPEAFADFASIENQEDVKSFNEKYGMELVIDVATV